MISISSAGNHPFTATRLVSLALAWFGSEARERYVLWLPVFLGVGIGTYFALPVEPPVELIGLPVVPVVAAAFLRFFGRIKLFQFALLLTAISAGFGFAQVRTVSVEAPVLDRKTGPIQFEGRVQRVEPTKLGFRLTLDRIWIAGKYPAETPRRIRTTVNGSAPPPLPGVRVGIRGVLQPPPAPSYPGGYDFARRAWFEGIGGVGFSYGAVTVLETADGTEYGFHVWLSRLRLQLTQRILAVGNSRTASIAAALLTGERRAIPETALDDMRDSGLAHLLAISGLHIGLIAGLLFFTVRLGLVLLGGVTLRWQTKKIAAVAAFCGACGYLLIAGAPIPTQRAVVMVGIVMLAVLLDRTAISLRLVAIAAAIILVLTPEAILSASFHMSFAAVIALVAAYEVAAPRMNVLRGRGGILSSRVVLFFLATLLTTLVASLATAPFAAYHFNRIALFGLLANAVAVPVMAIWIMPFAVLTFLALPLGLEALPLTAMGWGIDLVLSVAQTVAELPGAVSLVPTMPLIGLLAFVLGGLWLCIWQSRIRLVGLILIVLGFSSSWMAPLPHILVNEKGNLVAIRTDEGRVALIPGKGGRFEREIWLRYFAIKTAEWPNGLGHNGRLGCDSEGCVVHLRGQSTAIVTSPGAMSDCGRVDHVILLVRTSSRWCRDKTLMSTFHLWRDGAHSVRFGADGVPSIESVRETRGERPWSRLPERKRQYVRTSPTSRP